MITSIEDARRAARETLRELGPDQRVELYGGTAATSRTRMGLGWVLSVDEDGGYVTFRNAHTRDVTRIPLSCITGVEPQPYRHVDPVTRRPFRRQRLGGLKTSYTAIALIAVLAAGSGGKNAGCQADAATSGGHTSKGHNVSLGKRMAAKKGWRGDQFVCLNKLWTRESGWNDKAVNSSSGAYGIPQALGHGHPFRLGDARAQIRWGLRYIKNAYGTPCHAWGHSQRTGWY